MFEQDYIMRQIKEMVKALLKLLFNSDAGPAVSELPDAARDGETLKGLLDLADAGRIGEAEDRLFELAESGDRELLRAALLFYSHLNDKSDEFLEAHDFSRDEIKSGLHDIAGKFGIESLTDIFL